MGPRAANCLPLPDGRSHYGVWCLKQAASRFSDVAWWYHQQGPISPYIAHLRLIQPYSPSLVTSRRGNAGILGSDDPELEVRMGWWFGNCCGLGHQIHCEEVY